MRIFLKSLLAGLALLGAVSAYSQLVANSRFLARTHAALSAWARTGPDPDAGERASIVEALTQRAALYEREVEQEHLVDGMLVNLSDGDAHGTCDSLLFSALRYVGLKKLGFASAAGDAWSAIEQSQSGGLWVRHPRCSAKATSRDMLTGLLVALTQKPPGYTAHLRALLEQVQANAGFFGTGPIYVSYLTPGMAKDLRLVARSADVGDEALPPIVRRGYSTAEASLPWIEPGFEAHLIGLSIWIEMELIDQDPRLSNDVHGSWLGQLSGLIRWAGAGDLDAQRLQYATVRLNEIDPTNLFFRYLRLRAAGALTPKTAAAMAYSLLEMPAFPVDRLPRDCDREADYLWQRRPLERAGQELCHRVYGGADFVWMAALLAEPLAKPAPGSPEAVSQTESVYRLAR